MLERPNDVALLCLLRHLAGSLPEELRPKDMASRKEMGGEWSQMAKYAAAALFPKVLFLLTFEELYQMAVPLFVPTHISKYVYQYWFADQAKHLPRSQRRLYDPWRPATYSSLALCEWFQRPLVGRFNSLAHLLEQVAPGEAANLLRIRQAMQEENARVRSRVLQFWSRAIQAAADMRS